jgi:hypothetical protein
MGRRLDEFQSRSRRCGSGKNFPLPGMKTWSSLDYHYTELSWLSKCNKKVKVKKVKISLLQAVEAPRVARG